MSSNLSGDPNDLVPKWLWMREGSGCAAWCRRRAVGAVVLGSQYAAAAEGSLLVSGHGDGRLKLWRAGRGAAAADQGRVIGGSEGHAAEDTTVRCPTVSARSYRTLL